MAKDVDQGRIIQEQIRAAAASKESLTVVGGGSKAFYGRITSAEDKVLKVAGHRGIIRYTPSELVVTARCGTPLAEINAALAEHGQMLGFDPPAYDKTATLGGAIACGLAGPRRPYAGSIRDHVLGVTCVTGRGEILHFGGEVVKNVAGFDVPRLMVGSMGTLAVLLDVSLRVVPRPQYEVTLAFDVDQHEGMRRMHEWWKAGALPISAACHDGQQSYLRLSGYEAAVNAARARLGGEVYGKGEQFWSDLRDQRMDFFRLTDEESNLWRITVAPTAQPLKLVSDSLIEWGGALRWIKTILPSQVIRAIATRGSGHATLFRGERRYGMVFHPLPEGVYALHRRLKAAFDPQGILNPGRMYPDF
ncbi:MAG: glycolate oxidase subunit GlcE [Gammaproteobacteria bacterium]|nr:glycolate oxidase subunit GlcE [Gammaproteobacteria bacterium]